MSPNDTWTDPYEITADDRRLVEEFRRRPIGQHGPALQRILIKMRGEPLRGKYVLVCLKPHEEWALGRMTGDPKRPVEILDEVFTSLDEAEWEVFKRRWRRYTGEDLDAASPAS